MAIFILRDDVLAQGVSDDDLMKEARRAIQNPIESKKRKRYLYGLVCACGGALLTGVVWLLSVFL